jgi:hypothetical protein
MVVPASATAPVRRATALGVGAIAARALAGGVLGTLVGAFSAGFVQELVGFVFGAPWRDAWLLWPARAGGVLGAVWLAARAPRTRTARTSLRRRPPGSTRHGWVDLVFRTGIGVAWGAFALPCAVLALSVWLQAFGVHDEVDPVFGPIVGLWVLAAILPGAALGGVWFGCDLPWFRR